MKSTSKKDRELKVLVFMLIMITTVRLRMRRETCQRGHAVFVWTYTSGFSRQPGDLKITLSRPVDVYNDLADRKIACTLMYKLAVVTSGAPVRSFWRRISRFLAAAVSVLPVFDSAALKVNPPSWTAYRRRGRRCKAPAVADAMNSKAGDEDVLLKAGVMS